MFERIVILKKNAKLTGKYLAISSFFIKDIFIKGTGLGLVPQPFQFTFICSKSTIETL